MKRAECASTNCKNRAEKGWIYCEECFKKVWNERAELVKAAQARASLL
ncbi:hypothetical protein LCGC14_0488680 [marine sediment metagenome]|uniref:Uncharacterized protein n=1 Tax=marine sediment metagenome TaxID=412755 RepID=A0A0F9UU77_9ZZZZ